jgi:divalent metal cation (Fe/Co/Zn/Cd) transporter
MSIDELYQQSRRAALSGLAVTLTLGAAKLAGGLAGHSLALLSDSVHSFGDALSAMSVFGALLWAQQPPSREHPYGYTRAEAIAGSSVGLVLILSALWIAWEALSTLNAPRETPAWFTLIQELMDRQAEPEMLERVRQEALAAAGVKGVEKLRVRKTGLEYLVDIHVEVDPEISVRQGHAIGHAVKDRLVQNILTVKDVLVHIEPAPAQRRNPLP